MPHDAPGTSCHDLTRLEPSLWAGKTVVIAGGGSGGHVTPGMALVEFLKERLPEPPSIHWIGSANRLEAKLVPEAGIPFHALDINYFRRSLSGRALKQNISVLWRLSTGRTFREAESILREVGADLVISLGSFIGGPVVVAAHHAGIPSVALELNTVPGKATRWSAPVAEAIATSTPEALEALKRFAFKSYLTGTPVRPSIFNGSAAGGRFEFDLKPGKKTLLVLGGSQGAAGINQHIPALWKALNAAGQPGLNILHQTGEAGASGVQVPEGSEGGYALRPYINAMHHAYAMADLVLCRAGANTLAELTALGKPAILVPFPHSAEGHQLANAEAMAKKGVAICLPESALTPERLIAEVGGLLGDEAALEAFAAKALASAHSHSTGDVALVCQGVLQRWAAKGGMVQPIPLNVP